MILRKNIDSTSESVIHYENKLIFIEKTGHTYRMNPLAPCLSLSKYSSEAARDKALRKRKGVHLHPLGGDFAPLNWTVLSFFHLFH